MKMVTSNFESISVSKIENKRVFAIEGAVNGTKITVDRKKSNFQTHGSKEWFKC